LFVADVLIKASGRNLGQPEKRERQIIMANGDRKDPFKNHCFMVEIDGMSQAKFREVTIPESSQVPIESREGNEPPTVRKQPGW
jgi:hypothetical protein